MSKKSGKYSLVKNHYLCTLMKKIFILNLLFLLALSPAQENTAKKALYVKGNIFSLAVLMPNFGLEYQLSSKFTLQGDVFISPWKTFAGRHMQVYMGHMEGRYYFREAFKGWYVGANAGMAVFDISKWNYTSERYQRGFNYMLGAAVGYQLHWVAVLRRVFITDMRKKKKEFRATKSRLHGIKAESGFPTAGE